MKIKNISKLNKQSKLKLYSYLNWDFDDVLSIKEIKEVLEHINIGLDIYKEYDDDVELHNLGDNLTKQEIQQKITDINNILKS